LLDIKRKRRNKKRAMMMLAENKTTITDMTTKNIVKNTR
jgi:hypothetical protein